MNRPFLTAVLLVGYLSLFPQHSNAQSTPASAMLPNVPWLPQVPPGDNDNTKNCGPTCAAMIDGYFRQYSPATSQVTASRTWLAKYFGDNRYLDANGWYTDFGFPRCTLGQLITFYYGHNYYHYTNSNTTALAHLIATGYPVIAGVTISKGTLSTSGKTHWVVVVGYDQKYVYVNDPGTIYGRYRAYTWAAFDSTWATTGREMAAVWR